MQIPLIRGTQNTFACEAPFLSDTPWRTVWDGSKMSATGTDTDMRFQRYFSGVIAVRVGAVLRATQTVVPNVDVNVFCYGGPDFELANPNQRGNSFQPNVLGTFKVKPHSGKVAKYDPTGDKEKKFKAQLKKKVPPFDVNVDPASQTAHPLAPGSEFTYDPKVQHFGEKYDNLQELCKRYSTIVAQPTVHSTNHAATSGITSLWFNLNELLYTGLRKPFLARILSTFRLFRGPLNFKFRPISVVHTGATFDDFSYEVTFLPFPKTDPGPDQLDNIVASGFCLPAHPTTWGARGHNELEFQVPFLCHSGTCFIPNYKDNIQLADSAIFLNYGFLVIVKGDQNFIEQQPTWEISIAFGDETQVGCFMGFPPVKLHTNIWPDSWGTEAKDAIKNASIMSRRSTHGLISVKK